MGLSETNYINLIYLKVIPPPHTNAEPDTTFKDFKSNKNLY